MSISIALAALWILNHAYAEDNSTAMAGNMTNGNVSFQMGNNTTEIGNDSIEITDDTVGHISRRAR